MVEEKYTQNLEKLLVKVLEMHLQTNVINKTLEKLYPIAIVKDNEFYIFDVKDKSEYKFVKTGNIPGINIPKGILAAFTLPFYDSPGCVVMDESALETAEGLIFIFHEFVHCYQLETCENNLKADLEIYKEAMKTGDGMWEITHPFPYAEPGIAMLLESLYMYIKVRDISQIRITISELKKALKQIDFEYMIWQMWKEGYARYVENKLRVKLGLAMNSNDIKGIYDRVIFYELGSRLIELINVNSEIPLEELFDEIILLGE